MICGGQVNGSLTFSLVEDEWCHREKRERLLFSEPPHLHLESACLVHHRSDKGEYFLRNRTNCNANSVLINCQDEAFLSLQVNPEVT